MNFDMRDIRSHLEDNWQVWVWVILLIIGALWMRPNDCTSGVDADACEQAHI